ncbi:MAG: hypothetical protein ACKPFF_34545 [Planktothrix sp.]
MFSRLDIVKIVLRLGLPSSEFGMVARKAETLQRESEIIIQQIQDDLVKLDELEIKLNETASSQNFAIIKADVLEYGEKQKTYGILTEMLRISQRIAQMMSIKGNFSQIDEQLDLLGATPVQSGIVGRIIRS